MPSLAPLVKVSFDWQIARLGYEWDENERKAQEKKDKLRGKGKWHGKSSGRR